MDTRAFSASFEAPPPELQPVAVSRWAAQLADPQVERDYRRRRFPEDRRRAMLLMGLAAVINALIFLVELYTYSRGASIAPALIPPITGILLPITGLLIVAQLSSPALLEAARSCAPQPRSSCASAWCRCIRRSSTCGRR